MNYLFKQGEKVVCMCVFREGRGKDCNPMVCALRFPLNSGRGQAPGKVRALNKHTHTHARMQQRVYDQCDRDR